MANKNTRTDFIKSSVAPRGLRSTRGIASGKAWVAGVIPSFVGPTLSRESRQEDTAIIATTKLPPAANH